jgi:hypothetical protein
MYKGNEMNSELFENLKKGGEESWRRACEGMNCIELVEVRY